jgi:hypothetical protein
MIFSRPLSQKRPGVVGTLRQICPQGPTVWLMGVLLLGLALRLYAIDFQPPNADEHTSWDCARGILRTGMPVNVAGVLYTRSPLYHYGLAAWLALFGDNVASARCFSLLPSLGVILACYFLVTAISRRPSLGLLAALVMAVDPWSIATTQLIRFYLQVQFFALAATLCFLRGFVWKEGKRHQNLFFALATAGVLSQEVYATTFLALFLAFFLCYRPFSWKKDKNVWIGFTVMMAISLLDLAIYQVFCLEPFVAVSTECQSLFMLHFVDAHQVPALNIARLSTEFLWQTDGQGLLFTLFFAAGAFHWLRHPDRAVSVLYGIVCVSVPVLTVLIVPIRNRYCFHVYPMFVAAAILSAEALIRRATERLSFHGGKCPSALARRWYGLAAAVACAALVLGCEFNRVLASYEGCRVPDVDRAFGYIADHKQADDKVMAIRPPAGAVILGGIDYYLMVSSLFDELSMKQSGPVDRWAGGRVVWKTDQLRSVLCDHDRVWIVLDDQRRDRLSPEIQCLLYENCCIECEYFGGHVLLWDKTAGRYGTFADSGGETDSY